MRQSLTIIIVFALTVLASASSGSDLAESKRVANRVSVKAIPDLIPAPERLHEDHVSSDSVHEIQTLGYDDELASLSPGLQVGLTTFDLQSNCRMNRQVDWRGTQAIHFVWTKQGNFILGGDRGTGYEVWDPLEGSLVFQGPGGGCDIHPRLGYDNYSGYVGLDVDTEGRVVIGNHHRESSHYYTSKVWYDSAAAECNFVYTDTLPDTTMQYGVSPEQIASDEFRFMWPQMEYQVFDGDTVTHVFSQQKEYEIDPSFVHYFRRVGSDTVGAWDYPPMIVDTIPTISQSVSASRSSGKVALIWQATPPEIPGGGESRTLSGFDDGLGTYQRTNDVYYMMSQTMGSAGSWGPKVNATGFDSSQGGWLGGGDMSVLIDTDDYLHIVWPAREVVPEEGAMGEWTYFWGSRMLHWDELNDEVRPVKDANWDILDPRYVDSACTGGAWNQMSLAKPMISECDGKFYCVFVQFNDYFGGVYNDCAEFNFSAGMWNGTANGELYISVSDNGGYNWDIARNLTNTPTPHCDTSGTPYECESDHYPSVSRFGMDMTNGGDYSGVPIVDPSGSYTGTHYLDVFYLNDKFPGSCMQNAGIWTTNPLKWFRVPCVEPNLVPHLGVNPDEIAEPTWTKPGVELDTTIRLQNTGNTELRIDTILEVELTGSEYNWLAVDTSGPIILSHLSPDYYDITVHLNYEGHVTDGPYAFDGLLIVESDSPTSPDTISIHIIVADTIQTTPAGHDIYVQMNDQMSLQFDSVSQQGISAMTVTATGPEPPEYSEIIPEGSPVYFNIITSAMFVDTVHPCINYDDSGLIPEDEESLVLLKWYDGSWTDITSSLDTSADVICGLITSLSKFAVAIPGPDYICGDANGSATINLLDVTYLISYLYKSGPAPDPLEAGDANASGSINLLDITYLINYLYKGGPEPVCP